MPDADRLQPPGTLLLYPLECREWSDAIADLLCWFNGFAAGRPEAPLPPGIDALREINIKLKGYF